MIISQVYINGEAYEMVGIGDLNRSISEAWEITGSNCSVEVIDSEKLLFHAARTLPEGEVIIVEMYDENDERVFIGDADPAQCTYSEKRLTTSLKAENLFERIKGTVVQDETWKRPAGNTYTITEEAYRGDDGGDNQKPTDWLIVDHVVNLYPDDELEVEFIQDRKTKTEKLKVRYPSPAQNRIYLDKAPSIVIPVDTVVTRTNSEARFISVQNAFERLNADIQAIGSVVSRPLSIEGGIATLPGWLGASGALNDQIFTVTIENETAEIELDEPVTAPYPPPLFNDQVGSVRLMTRTGNNVLARWLTSGAEVQTVEFGFGVEPSIASWSVSQSFHSAVDWTPHVASEPSSFMTQILEERRGAFDYSAMKRYRIAPEGDNDNKRLLSYDWDSGTNSWINETLINGNLNSPSFIYNLTYDHQNQKLYVAGHDRIYQVNRGNGAYSDLTGPLDAMGDIAFLSLDQILVMSTQGGLVIFNPTDWSSETIKTGYRHFVNTVRMWNGRLFFVGTKSDTTALLCYEKIDGEWTEIFVDQLTDFQAGSATLVTAADYIFIEVHGLLFTHSTTLLPILPRADVSGMTVGDVAQNLAFFANATLRDDPEGAVHVEPKTAIPAPTYAVTECDSVSRTANWPEQYQRIVIEGKADGVSGAALTQIPGESWEITSAPFVFMSSHARAIALTLLSFHKYKRREIQIEAEELDGIQPLETFTFEGVTYQAIEIDYDIQTQSVRNNAVSLPTVSALEVLTHEL